MKIWNESALGVLRFAWTSADGKRCEVLWCDGAAMPSFSFWVSSGACMSPLTPIRNPQRFGWPIGSRIRLVDVKTFTQRFADALWAEETA